MCEKFSLQKQLEVYQRFADRRSFRRRETKSFLQGLRSNRFESLPDMILSCKKKLNLGTESKNPCRFMEDWE